MNASRNALRRRPVRPSALGALAGLLLAGCASVEPFDYTPINAIPSGPGLFSGADGVFTVNLEGEPGPGEDDPAAPERN